MFNLIMFTIAMAVVAAILRGWILTVLWGWFIVPLGVPSISIATALGIVIIIDMLVHRPDTSETKDKVATVPELLGIVFSKAFLSPLITLGLAAIVASFV